MPRPEYLHFESFVAVLTPHFIEQWHDRSELRNHIELPARFISKIWSNAPINTTVAVQFGNGYIYSRKKHNELRRRWELEFISFTPNKRVQTANNKTAKLLRMT